MIGKKPFCSQQVKKKWNKINAGVSFYSEETMPPADPLMDVYFRGYARAVWRTIPNNVNIKMFTGANKRANCTIFASFFLFFKRMTLIITSRICKMKKKNINSLIMPYEGEIVIENTCTYLLENEWKKGVLRTHWFWKMMQCATKEAFIKPQP